MPDVWLPGATIRPGRLAGYERGHNRMQFAVEHFTVGTNSVGIGDRGYFHILFPKVGPPIQFAEIDAVTWHAGDWNRYGPGAEWERLGYHESLTQDQIEWGARWHSLCAEWGIPVVHRRYDGTRFNPSDYHGFVDHGAIDDQRTDGVTDEEFAAMTQGATPPPAPGEDYSEEGTMLIVKKSDGTAAIILPPHKPQKIPSVNEFQRGTFVLLEDGAWQQYWDDAIKLYQAATR